MIREAHKIHTDEVGHIPLHQQAIVWAVAQQHRPRAAGG